MDLTALFNDWLVLLVVLTVVNIYVAQKGKERGKPLVDRGTTDAIDYVAIVLLFVCGLLLPVVVTYIGLAIIQLLIKLVGGPTYLYVPFGGGSF